MPIVQRVPGSRLMLLNGMTSQLKTNTLNSEGLAIPTTLVKECVGSLPVLGDLSTDDLQNNDFTSVLSFVFPEITTTFTLLDSNCNEIATLDARCNGASQQIRPGW